MIIGIIGLAGSGKNTAGDYLVSKGFKQDSFAAPLKDVTSAIFGWPRHLLEGDTKVSRDFREQIDPYWSVKFGYDVTPRHILQFIGTEVMRNSLHPDIWIDSMEKRIISNGCDMVITDVRFPNEVEFIKSLNFGKIIRITRGEEKDFYKNAIKINEEFDYGNKPDIPLHIDGVHYSEWATAGMTVDYELDNSGNIQHLYDEIDKLLA